MEDVPDLDAIVTPVGGGGLASGTALIAQARRPQLAVWGVEPEAGDDVRRSLEAGSIQRVDASATIADGLRTPQPSELTFSILRQRLAGIVTVSDAELMETVRFLLLRAKLLAEPSGVAGLAALLHGKLKLRGRVGVVISGGNVDPDALARYLSA